MMKISLSGGPALMAAVKDHVEHCPHCMKKYVALKLTFDLEGCAEETASPLLRRMAERVRACDGENR